MSNAASVFFQVGKHVMKLGSKIITEAAVHRQKDVITGCYRKRIAPGRGKPFYSGHCYPICLSVY